MKALLARLAKLTKGLAGSLLVAGSLAILTIVFMLTPAHDQLENYLYDLRFRLKPEPAVLSSLVLLNVDDSSITTLGHYPWPRHYYASIVDQLNSVGLANLAFDFQFMDRSMAMVDPQGYSLLTRALDQGMTIQSADLGVAFIDSDAELARATSAYSGTVIPYSFSEILINPIQTPREALERDQAILIFKEKASRPIPAGREQEFEGLAVQNRKDIQYPIPPLVASANLFGYVDSDPDADGTQRKVSLVRAFEGRLYYHLALVTFLDMCGAGLDDVEVYPGKNLVINNAVHPETGKKGQISIPLEKDGTLLIDWIGDFTHTARQLSAYALLEYPSNAESVDFQLMLKDMISGKEDRARLADEITGLRIAIKSAADAERRHPLRIAYREKMTQYRTLIQGYLDASKAELKALEDQAAAGQAVDQEGVESVRQLIIALMSKMEVEDLFDSVAVMGLTATGTQDIGVTPLDNMYWMVGSYPTIINTLAQGRFITRLPVLATMGLVLALALALSLFIHGRSAKLSYAGIAAAIVLVNGAAILAFSYAYLWLDMVSLNLALILPALVIMVAKFAGEEQSRRFIHGAFSKYLSTDVIKQIIANPDALKLGGESREISIFFSDIAGFSGISEKLTPEQLVQLLNEYLSEMTDIIMENRGTVDKYEGDAIMAFWGAPLHFDDHAYQACLSAVNMQRKLEELRAFWRKEGRHELRVRMGINSGLAVAGNMGSRTRMNYTVMGDAVNLASRLEGANKPYGTYAMVSDNTYAAVKNQFRFRELDKIRVVGKSVPITVYELLEMAGPLPDQKEEVLGLYEKGLDLFKNRGWEEARIAFIKALSVDPTDGPSKTYLDRCGVFLEAPPEADWDGVFRLTSK